MIIFGNFLSYIILHIDIKLDAVHESRSLKALEYMLDFMPQAEKDALLMVNLKKTIEKKNLMD